MFMTSAFSTAAALARVRAWRQAVGWATYRFATEAGVAEASLRGMDSEEWNPTVRTLERLEAVIPRDWRAGDPVPEIAPKAGKARAA